MNATIRISSEDIGNSRRGYHNTRTTITFEYGAESWIGEREEEIVASLTGKGRGMWWRPSRKEDGAWVVEHGYDSSD